MNLQNSTEWKEKTMKTFYDETFDKYLQCTSKRKTFPDQIKEGTVYHCKGKFFDGEDYYTNVYLSSKNRETELHIGTLSLKHFSECIDLKKWSNMSMPNSDDEIIIKK